MANRLDVTAAPPVLDYSSYLLEARRHLSADTKTATRIAPSLDRAAAGSENALWWPAFDSCPGASSACAGRLHTGNPSDSVACYAWRLEQPRKALRDLARWRWERFHELDALDAAALAVAIARTTWQGQVDRGVTRPLLRLSASGDLDAATARAWGTALRNPAGLELDKLDDKLDGLTVWTYTRSYGAVARNAAAAFLDADGRPPPRTTLYLSTDRSMLERTQRALAGLFHRCPVAVLADTLEDGRAQLVELGRGDRRRIPCPDDTGRMPLVVTPRRRPASGACAHCRACAPPTATAPDIIFLRR